MGFASRALLAGGLGFAASFLVACGGGSNLLSANQSSTLSSHLDEVAAAVDARQCGGAARGAASAANQVSNLPKKVSPVLRANLLQGVRTLNQVSQRDCRKTTSTAPTTSSSTTTPTSTTTTTPSTTSTTTTSTTTTTPSSTTTTPATSTTTPGSTSTTTSTSGGAGIGGGTTTTSGGTSGGGSTGQ